MYVISFCVYIMCFVVLISFFGLHYVIDIWVRCVLVGGGMNLGSLICMGVICVCINLV